jgi:uncharacterized protein (DUF736 family)
MAYDNRNSGVLFKNDRKQAGSKQPDFNGTLNVGGVEHQLAGWIREARNGRKFFSLKLTPPGSGRDGRDMPPPVQDDSDIPF